MHSLRLTQLVTTLMLAAACAVAGCRSVSWGPAHRSDGAGPAAAPAAAGLPTPLVAPVAYQAEPAPSPVGTEVDDPLAGDVALRLPRLIDAVVARNPTLESAMAAWQAAAQRYPQVVALDDPMFGFTVGPASWNASGIRAGYMVELQQKFSWPGKRSLRGCIADAETHVAHLGVEDVRLRLALAASQAFADYHEVRRALELNTETTQVLRESRQTADAKYRTGQVTQQDLLQADVELAETARRRLELERRERVAVARINTLLHRLPDHPLPPPLAELPPIASVPAVDALRQVALARRPDLAALAAQVEADNAAVNLAQRDFYPDLTFVGKYNAYMQEEPLRPEVGLAVDVPLHRQRRWAAVREACFRLQQRRAELNARVAEINQEVTFAYAAVEESRRALELYRETLLPTTLQNLNSARAGYVVAKVDFLRLIEAQRQLIMAREKNLEIEAEYHRRWAELERVVGGPLPPGD